MKENKILNKVSIWLMIGLIVMQSGGSTLLVASEVYSELMVEQETSIESESASEAAEASEPASEAAEESEAASEATEESEATSEATEESEPANEIIDESEVGSQQVSQSSNTTAPILSGVIDQEIDIKTSFDPMDGVTATDDVDGNITNLIEVSGTVDTDIPGTYQLIYKITDSSGNQTTESSQVTVRETKTYENYNGTTDKLIIHYNELGQKYKSYQYYSNGRIHYKYEYYTNGTISKRSSYRNDKESTRADYYQTYSATNSVKQIFRTFYQSTGNTAKITERNEDGSLKVINSYYSSGAHYMYDSYNHGVRNNYHEYYTNGQDSKIYHYYSSGRIKERTTYNYSGQRTSYYERYDANLGTDFQGQFKRYYTYKNGDLIIAEYWNSAGVRTSYREYYTSGPAKTIFYYYPSGRIKNRITYATNSKRMSYYERFDANNGSDFHGRIKNYVTYNSNGNVVKREYWNSAGVRTDYREYHSNGKAKARYYYYSNGKVERKYFYNTNGVLTSSARYQTDGKLSKQLTYYSNAKASYIKDYHYQKNGVLTGTTQKWYTTTGSISKIDAKTFPTYYSQYTSKYKNYSCPAYHGDMYKHGCIMNSMAMYYSIYNNDELTPIELYNQGYHCFFDVEAAYARNGLNVKEVQVAGNKRSAYTPFTNRSNAIPNGKSTFTIKEALVDYGMPVQLMMRSDGHIRNNFPGHSILAYRYVYENGHSNIYAKDPGAKGPTVNLQSYMNGNYHEYGASWYQIENAWVGGVK